MNTLLLILNSFGLGGLGLLVYTTFKAFRREIAALDRTSQAYEKNQQFTAEVNEALRRDVARQSEEIARLQALTKVPRHLPVGEPHRARGLSDHVSLADALSEAQVSEYGDYNTSVSRLIDDPRANWPAILLLARCIPSADSLVDRLLLRGSRPCLLLATLVAGYGRSVSNSSVQKLFVRTGRFYQVSRQVPTYLIAQELRFLGANGIAGLSQFLDVVFCESEHDGAGLVDLGGEDILQWARIDPAARAMLRRLAIDTLGAIRLPACTSYLIEAFRRYSELEVRDQASPQSVNEWQHNRWHVCFAMHLNPDESSTTYLRSVLEQDGCDVLTELEILYHLAKFSDGGRHANLVAQQVRDRLPALSRALQDGFNWRRAHGCETAMRIYSLSEQTGKLVCLELESMIASLARSDPDYMVRHYACLALGQIGSVERTEQLVSTAVDREVEPWARFAAARALSLLLERTRVPLPESAVARINKSLTASIAGISRESRRVRLDDVVLGSLIALLSDHGTQDSLPVLGRYTQVDVDVIAFGNLATLAEAALSRCIQRVELHLTEVGGEAEQ